MATYEELVAAAGDLWTGSGMDEVNENLAYLYGQEQTISNAFNTPVEKVHEDILDAGGVYRDLEWDGTRVPLIESGTNPWVADAESGEVFNFGGDGETFRELTSGVLVSYTSVQVNDEAGMTEDFTDLHAARIAAAEVTRITGRKHIVRFHGTY